MDNVRVLDAAALKALAHPLRVSLLSLLQDEGPATATSLAQRLDESSGATSYHLRQLHAAGLVEEDTERGNQRERWWRPGQRGLRLYGTDLPDDPATRAATNVFMREIERRRANRIQRWHAEAEDWPEEWQDTSMESDWTMRMRPEQLRALRDEVFETIERHRPADDEEPADGERVVVMFQAFPQHRDDTEKGAT